MLASTLGRVPTPGDLLDAYRNNPPGAVVVDYPGVPSTWRTATARRVTNDYALVYVLGSDLTVAVSC